MAIRPVYVALEKFPYFERVDVNFKFYQGRAISQKVLNTQACAAAIFIGLCRADLLDAAVESKENFLKIVYQGEC